MAKLPKTVYVFHANPDDADSLIVTAYQDTAFPVNDDGPVTVGVYELTETVVRGHLQALRAAGVVTWEPRRAKTLRVVPPYAVDPAGHVTPLDAVPVAVSRRV